jgi:hypothetical protein
MDDVEFAEEEIPGEEIIFVPTKTPFEKAFPRGEFSDILLFFMLFLLVILLSIIGKTEIAITAAGSLIGGVFAYVKDRRILKPKANND